MGVDVQGHGLQVAVAALEGRSLAQARAASTRRISRMASSQSRAAIIPAAIWSR